MLNHSEDSGADNSLLMYFITIDIETIKTNNNLVPYLICGYNGSEYITSYGLNQRTLFNDFINKLFTLFENRKRFFNCICS